MPNGILWLREDAGEVTEVVRFSPDQNAPQTVLESASDQISSAGNVLMAWFGRDLWDDTAPRDMRYQWRLNDDTWTSIGRQTRHTLTSLPDGPHVFAVRSVDRDGNVDPTPAIHTFFVEAPWWKNSWVIGGTIILVGLVIVQTGRVVRRDRRLQESNKILHEKTESLEEGNRQIQEANRLKSQFLANMSHELRTPLNAILGFSQLMTRDSGLTDKHKENLEVIGRSGEHLLGLINDVLDMSKIEAGQVELSEENFDLHRLLNSLEEMFLLRANDKNLELIFKRTLEVPQYIQGDEGKIRQILINLLGNAIKFTEAGKVTLRISCTGENSDTHLFFEIEDTGPGIASEEVALLFDAFVQTRVGQQANEGTGLGLPISQEHVRLMGGEIQVESKVNKGSIFRFHIRVATVEAKEIEIQQIDRRVVGIAPDQEVYRILVVDDAVENRRLLREILTPIGFEIQEAENGQQGVEAWKAWKPHLIWMDMRMPIMDGYEATKQIKAADRDRDTIVVALTASAFEEERAEVLTAGCDEFVRKPVSEKDVFDTIAQQLGVRFIYDTERPTNRPKTPASLALDALSGLPLDWIRAFHQAASEADTEAAENLIYEIEAAQEDLAKELTNLVKNFQFEKILTLTQMKNSS